MNNVLLQFKYSWKLVQALLGNSAVYTSKFYLISWNAHETWHVITCTYVHVDATDISLNKRDRMSGISWVDTYFHAE